MNRLNRKDPKVSVILTVDNAAPFLRQCLDSLCCQTLEDIEIICVDDASNDASLAILRQYALEDERIVVVEQEHGGASKARNTGLSRARGQYLSILDADDFFEPTMLEHLWHTAHQYQAQIVIGRADFYDHPQGTFVPCEYSVHPENLPSHQPFSSQEMADRLFNIGCCRSWDKLFERRFVEDNHICFQELLTASNMLFVFYAYSRAERMCFVDEVVAHHRIHAHTSLSVTQEESGDNFYQALMALKERLRQDGTYDRLEHTFLNWALHFTLQHIDTLREPVRRQLLIRCRKEFFASLGLLTQVPDMFDDRQAYRRMCDILQEKPFYKVSVIVPVYNGAAYLRPCLDSIAGQTLQEIQIICVDDGSTDETASILEEYAARDDRFLIVHKEHTNAGDSRNRGLLLAEGEYLSFLDADDFFENCLLQDTYAAAHREQAEICLFRCDQYHTDTDRFTSCPWTLKLEEMPFHRPFAAWECRDRLFTMVNCAAWNKLFRRDFIERHNLHFQSIESCNDMCFTFSALALGECITTLDRVLVHQRVGHARTLCQDVSLLWDNFDRALAALQIFLMERSLDSLYHRSFLNWAVDFCLWHYHNGVETYRDHIRYRLVTHTFQTLGLTEAPAEVFFNKGFYHEMQQLLSERNTLTDPSLPLVSVIVTVYNGEAYLKDCLDSILRQTLHRIEVIVVDDGSTDHTPLILADYAAQDHRLTVITKEHTNAGESRNAGLAAARGEYLSFLDADDFFEVTLLEQAYRQAREHEADICLLPSDQYHQGDKRYHPSPWMLQWHLLPPQPFSAERAAEHLFQLSNCTAWNKLVSRQLIQRYGLHFQSNLICNDAFFTFSAMSVAERITAVEGIPLIHQRVGHAKILAAPFEYCTGCYAAAVSAVQQFLEENGRYRWFEKTFLNWALDFSLFALHSYEGVNGRLVRQQLKRRYFDRWHVSSAPAELFERKEQYAEKQAIVSERVVLPPRTRPMVSVVMPLFNVERYLPAALDSLLFQTYENIEILCVDDGSTDATLSIVRQYRKEDRRVHLIRQEHQGAGAARNKGLHYVRGQYVLFLDGDDLFHADLIEKSLARAQETAADIVAFNFTQSDAAGNYVHRIGIHTEWLDRDYTVFSYRDCPERIMTVVNPTPWNKLFRTDFIRQHHLAFEEITSSNDITFAAVSVAAAERIAYLKDELLHYNRGLPGSITAGKHKKLGNVITAVTSAVRQAEALPYAEDLTEAILCFAIDNLLFALKNNVLDYHDTLAHQYYDFVHEYFNRPAFDEVTEEWFGTNTVLYDRFRIVRTMPYEDFIAALDRQRIVSVTSYPARIHAAATALRTLTEQTVPADRIILWLAEEQFPEREQALPPDLLTLLTDGQVQLRWCPEDLAPHKKYFYAMQDYPEAVIITTDDDILYPKTMIEELMRGYLLYPDCVSAVRTHLMTFSPDGKLLPYDQWVQEYDGQRMQPSRQLMAVGVGGVLYPPHRLSNVLFRADTIRHTCLMADDLWLKAIECLSEVPVVCVGKNRPLQYVPDSQEIALWKTNVTLQKNDSQFKHILRALAKDRGKCFLQDYILSDPCFLSFQDLTMVRLQKAERKAQEWQQRFRQLQQQYQTLQADYRALKEQYGGFRIFSSVVDWGMTRGERLERIYQEMPSSSILLTDITEVAEQDRPSRFGILQIIKLSKARGSICFLAKEENGNAHMFLQNDNKPTGVWLFDTVFVPATPRHSS